MGVKVNGKPLDDLAKINGSDIITAGTTVAGQVKTGETFYAGSSTLLTGDGTKTLSAANETVNAGYYAATTLSAVDADLAVGNIKQGTTIFGFAGTFVAGGTETIEKYADAELTTGQSYTPAASGIFHIVSDNSHTIQYFSASGGWLSPRAYTQHQGATAIGDGANFRVYCESNGEYILMRHYFSTGTYERARDEQLANNATWTPGNSGFFADGSESLVCWLQINRTTAGWGGVREITAGSTGLTIVIGNGADLRVKNDSGSAKYHATMRAKMV